ncbi:MAG: transcription termination factor Rho [Myxococcales bacterium]|jgi:transcription termination factor Rho
MSNGSEEAQTPPEQAHSEPSRPAEQQAPAPQDGERRQAAGLEVGGQRPEAPNGGLQTSHLDQAPGQPGERRGRKRRRRRRRSQAAATQGSAEGAPTPGVEGPTVQAGPGPQLQPAEGVLDYDGRGNFGYLRQARRNFLATAEDPEIPRQLIQRMRVRKGQYVRGLGTPRGNRVQLQRIETLDGELPEVASRYPQLPDLTVVDPERRIQLEYSSTDMVTRVLDLIAPIGFGQRGLIVSPPKAGKTIMLQRIARAISENHPKAHLMVLLVDERPEEVTDMRRSIEGEVLASSSDRPTSDHLQVAEMCLERARRLVEQGKDVVVLLDSITRLARAYNKEVESSGRTLTGGVDSRALERPKRIFGSARKTEEAGSLTILGTALVDTGSRMDEVIFEEFKGTGNLEVTLDRQLAERRIFPAINIPQSGTRKEEKLMTPKEWEKVKKLRQMLFAMKPADAMEKLIKKLSEFETNDEFLDAV